MGEFSSVKKADVMGTYGAARGNQVKEQTRPYKHLEIHETQGKCIENSEASCVPMG